ncbi:MAG: DUF1302 family protein [Atribacterota bacterium]
MSRILYIPVTVVVLTLLFVPLARSLEWSGEVVGNVSYQLNTADVDYGLKLNAMTTLDLGEGYYLHADLSLKYQDENTTRPFHLNQLYLQGSGAPWDSLDFKLGLLELTWGASDVLSPVDVLNPRPFSLSADRESFQDKIPVPAVDIEWYFSSTWSLELFYQPDFVPNFIPSFVKEAMFLGSLSAALGLDFGEAVVRIEEDTPSVGFFSPIWAIRARGSVGKFDVALSFQNGYYLSPFPYQTSITMEGERVQEVDILAGYPRRSLLGLEFQGTIEGLEGVTVRGDLALIFPQPWTQSILINGNPVSSFSVLEEPYWKASFGIDYTHENFYLNLNYLLGNPWEEGQNVSSYLYLVTNWESEDGKWKPFWNAILSLQDGSMVNILGVEYKPKTSWTTSLSYARSSGAPGSILGGFSDGIFLEVKYRF